MSTTKLIRQKDEQRDQEYSYDQARRKFVVSYNSLSDRAIETAKTSNEKAADIHAKIVCLNSNFFVQWKRDLSNEEIKFLKNDIVARTLQALSLKAISMSGFVELSMNLASKKKLNEDIESTLESISCNGSATGTSDINVANIITFIPYSENPNRIDKLIGYENSCRELIQSYYIVQSNDNLIRPKYGNNVILHGPPGTGKTTTALAAAGTLGLNCYVVNSENLVSAYRSETEKNLAAVYAFLRKSVADNGRNVLFLMDEVDGLVKSRSQSQISSGEYSLLTKFLQILEPNDGTDNYGIMSVFTTNKLVNLDDAFVRRCKTIFMGYIHSQLDRKRLIESMYIDQVNWTDNALNEAATNITREWVPGDHTRFIRYDVSSMRMSKYLSEENISSVQFYESLSANTDKTNRTVDIDMPKLNSSEILVAMKVYKPITDKTTYIREYGTYDPLAVLS